MSGEEDENGKRRWRRPGAATPDGGGRQNQNRQKVHKKRLGKSSREWIDRQLNDPYVRKAKEQGYRARAAFKLAEIDDRFKLLGRNARVVDLGCAPGGWMQVALARGASSVLGIDLSPVDPLEGAEIIEGDFTDPKVVAEMISRLQDRPTIVLSDMAAPTMGHRQTDHIRTLALAEAAARFAIDQLAPRGAFVSKVFQGGAQGELLEMLKANFAQVRHWKPPSSRQESPETFVIARGFHGASAAPADPEPEG